MSSRHAALLLCLFGVGCSAPHKAITARRTACRYNDIKLSAEVYEPTEERWLATCGARSYACSTRDVGGRRLKYECHFLDAGAAVEQQDAAAGPNLRAGGIDGGLP